MMVVTRHTLDLLRDPVAQELLQSRNPAQLAYIWSDGTPRVVPIWFHWTGQELVVAGPPDAPKVEAIRDNSAVAVTINDASVWPYTSLTIRGTARVEIVPGVAPEYAAAAMRYFGEEQGRGWVQTVDQLLPETACVRITPEWVGILDFQTRFPSALAKRMG
jgi:hypothetical protein